MESTGDDDFFEEDEHIDELMDIVAGGPDGVTERPASAGQVTSAPNMITVSAPVAPPFEAGPERSPELVQG